MRELTLTELELVSGGNNSDVTEVDEIVVIGDRGDSGDWGDWGDWGDNGDYGDQGDYGGGDAGPPPDEASIDVTVNIQRPLTAEEEAAVNKLKEIRSEITSKINSIADSEVITLADGSKVTGAELKQLWAKTDFTINEVGTTYSNNTTRGEADLNGGDPKISINIDIVKGYADSPGGITYMALHELGHVTSAGQSHNNSGSPINEQVANDIARAIAHDLGMVILSNPLGGGYSTTSPLLFSTPSTGSGETGGSGGSGGSPNQQEY